MTNNKIKAILWDMDGVLIDTTEFHFISWRDTLEKFGIEHSYEEFLKHYGMNNINVLTSLFGEKPTPQFLEQVGGSKEEAFREAIKGKAVLMQGVREWLEYFRRKGLKQAIASSAPPENIDFLVKELRITPYFDHLVSGYYMNGKPFPDVYLKTAEMVGEAPQNCLVIEDSPAGVESAHRAGMPVLALLTTNKLEDLPDPNFLLQDLTAVSPGEFCQNNLDC